MKGVGKKRGREKQGGKERGEKKGNEGEGRGEERQILQAKVLLMASTKLDRNLNVSSQ